MKKAASALVLLSLLAATEPKPVKKEDDRHTRTYWENASARTYVAIDKFADCIVRYRFVDVKTLLALPVDSPRVDSFGRALATTSGECLAAAGLGFQVQVFRWSLIESLYRRDLLKRGGPPSIALGGDAGQIDGAKCVVARAPALSEAILRTSPGSKQQAAAMKLIAPAASDCGLEQPRSLSATQHIRFQLAEDLYRYRQGGMEASE